MFNFVINIITVRLKKMEIFLCSSGVLQFASIDVNHIIYPKMAGLPEKSLQGFCIAHVE